jgi:tetratricopeptide (TPR) repeat protein
MPDLADAYHETADKRAFEILTKARSAGNPMTRARAAVRLGAFPLERPSGITKGQRAALRAEARAAFEAEGHDLGLAEYWLAEAEERWSAARAAETAEACEHALLHLERAGAAQSHTGQRTRELLLRTYIYSPIPVDDALARVSELSRDDDGPLVRAEEGLVIGSLLSMKGEINRALDLVRGARQMFADAGLLVSASRGTFEADIAIRAGDWPKAERTLRDGFERLEELGEHSYSSTIAAHLPMVLVSQRKLAAAREALDQARRLTADDDLINFVFIELAEGRLLAHEDRLAEAEAVGRHAVELADRIDFCFGRPLAHSYFAETLALAGKPEEAARHATTALGILEAKGDVMLAARVRERLAAAGVRTSKAVI